MVANVEQLKGAKAAVEALIKEKNCHPVMVRLGWHDAGSFDKRVTEWPECGGANGSIRFGPELGYGANAGLSPIVDMLKPIKEEFDAVSWADLFQMAGAAAIELSGGPMLAMRYGRLDAPAPSPDGRLPAAAAPFYDNAATPADHLRNVFHRMGLSDQDIVALSGAHTLGRAYKSRSGFGKDETKYTKDGPGTKGGQSWTPEWLKFDNSYFVEVKEKRDAELLVLPTDAALFEDDKFAPFAEKYAADSAAFFADYAVSHVKLAELGSRWDGEPVAI